ncbi:MAG: sialate O-acetylesterase [Prosthecobacter sp.]|uniref:sialate O-acetylesterase n=1 Tax=Prosthecobacter sp. TaxID=1965333 RepID=UPI002605DBEA|nr:sialate O-acetylesterase [Prosthecobacter sp.]MCF7788887.1 sialate O-acetylesterase [Prosthecobacter sp.]
MKCFLLLSAFLVALCKLHAQTTPPEAAPAQLKLNAPLDYQVFQRRDAHKGNIAISGVFAQMPNEVLVRSVVNGQSSDWKPLTVAINDLSFSAGFELPAGGWHRLELRTKLNGKVIEEATVEHVGIGEIFIVAGQSNSANHGEEKQSTQTGRVAAFDGRRWQLANDPQPGASGKGGSFMPPLGDALVKKFNVPIAFIPCGIGATSVREWLPKGVTFPHPPTIESRVHKLPGGEWESRGDAYAGLLEHMQDAGPHGFRAVLWHQGESDANQKDTTRTLPGKLYREHLEYIIRTSRREIGWEAPWFVAQVSYHVPGDEASADIRAAQAALWQNGVALAGPDSDALKGELRERHGQGVHFSGQGLREHGSRWASQITPWLQQQLK